MCQTPSWMRATACQVLSWGEALFCARLHAEKAPTVCPPELAKTLLCRDLFWDELL